MQVNFFLKRIFQIFLLTLLMTIAPHILLAQTSPQSTPEKDDQNETEASLQGLTEAILIDGLPVLRILSRKNGSTNVKFQKRDGEDALVFEVHKISYRVPEGKLYVTKSKVIFDPYEKKSAYFNFAKTEITKVSVKKQIGADGMGTISIRTKDGGEAVTMLFDGEDLAIGSKKFVMPAISFVSRAIENFDSALLEFNKLTESVRPKDESDEEIEETETEAEVSDKYDRFKDITIIQTSRMLLRGSKRSIRTHAEYSFAGKNQIKPEKVLLYFHASAARPLFREDDLELNFLVDGKRLPIGEMRLTDEEKTKTTVRQTVAVTIPFETFAQIANAQKAEFQIGTLEYKLTDVHLEAFRKLLAYKVEDADDK